MRVMRGIKRMLPRPVKRAIKGLLEMPGVRHLPALVAARAASAEEQFRFRSHLVNFRRWDRDPKIRLPPIEFVSIADPTEDDLRICERLATAYRRAMADSDREQPTGLWRTNAESYHGELIAALSTPDVRAAASIFGRMFIDRITHGLALGEAAYRGAKQDPQGLQLEWHDNALALGQAIGVVYMENPEQGEIGRLLDRDSREILHSVAAQLGIDLTFPQIGAVFGCRVGPCIIPRHYLLHLYTANRLRTLLGKAGWDGLEIGGGTGMLAYAAALMGARRHWIVDLPLVNAIQGYFLLKSELSERVVLFGEAPRNAADSIMLLPNWKIGDLAGEHFHIVVNQDSLPEMGEETASSYLRFIDRLRPDWFLSINQEARAIGGDGLPQPPVSMLMRRIGGSHRLVYRVPYWIRRGYVEEAYRYPRNPGT